MVGKFLTEKELANGNEKAMLNVSILVHDKVMVSLHGICMHVMLCMSMWWMLCASQYNINPCCLCLLWMLV